MDETRATVNDGEVAGLYKLVGAATGLKIATLYAGGDSLLAMTRGTSVTYWYDESRRIYVLQRPLFSSRNFVQQGGRASASSSHPHT